MNSYNPNYVILKGGSQADELLQEESIQSLKEEIQEIKAQVAIHEKDLHSIAQQWPDLDKSLESLHRYTRSNFNGVNDLRSELRARGPFIYKGPSSFDLFGNVGNESEADSVADSVAESVAESEADSVAESVADSVAESETDSEANSEADSEADSEDIGLLLHELLDRQSEAESEDLRLLLNQLHDRKSEVTNEDLGLLLHQQLDRLSEVESTR